MARGRKHEFTEIELYYIQGMCKKMTAEQISEKLGVNLDQVREKVEFFKKTKLPNAYDMMVTESNNKKHKVAIMTQGAAMLGDESRSKVVSTPTDKGLHVINPNR